MNTLETQIQKDIMTAMKEKDSVRLSACRNIKSAILVAKTAAGASSELTDADIIKLIQKLAKQRKESVEIYESAGRAELAAAERAEMEVLETYLPKALSEDEVEALVKQIIDSVGATSMKDMGKVMGVASKQLAGQADGRVISGAVKKLLS